jgi:hypothetical protein
MYRLSAVIHRLQRRAPKLAAAKAAKEAGQALSLDDLVESVRTLRSRLPEIHASAIRGARLARRDAHAEGELFQRFYRLTREISAENVRRIQETRERALTERKTFYIPLAHPEQG